MKKVLIAGLAALSLVSVSAPASAGGNPWPVIGGVVGGLLLGEALRNHDHDHDHRYYDEGYYQSGGYYVQPQVMCWDEYQRVWNPYIGRWEVRRYRQCD